MHAIKTYAGRIGGDFNERVVCQASARLAVMKRRSLGVLASHKNGAVRSLVVPSSVRREPERDPPASAPPEFNRSPLVSHPVVVPRRKALSSGLLISTKYIS